PQLKSSGPHGGFRASKRSRRRRKRSGTRATPEVFARAAEMQKSKENQGFLNVSPVSERDRSTMKNALETATSFPVSIVIKAWREGAIFRARNAVEMRLHQDSENVKNGC